MRVIITIFCLLTLTISNVSHAFTFHDSKILSSNTVRNRSLKPSVFSLNGRRNNEHEDIVDSKIVERSQVVYPRRVETAEENNLTSRRSAFESTSKALASFLLLSSISTTSSPFVANAKVTDDYVSPPKVIVITGCNSGIGFDAAQRMAGRGHTIILACRTLSKANEAALKIGGEAENSAAPIGTLIPKECDLADLESVRAFAKSLKDEGVKIDTLCLNAGVSRNVKAQDVLRTKQGFELTVGTNHLGHFLLSQLLLPSMKKDSGRIVVTASGVHDPESPGGAQGSKATLGALEGFEMAVTNGSRKFDMVDGKSFDADKAYKDSKLCNVLFSLELQRRLNMGGTGVDVDCFNPGLIVSTGLFRDQNQLFTKVFDVAATDVFKVGETVSWGGGALEYLSIRSNRSKGGSYFSSPAGSSKYGDEAYGNQFTSTNVSKEAMDEVKAKRLWELSEILVGIESA